MVGAVWSTGGLSGESEKSTSSGELTQRAVWDGDLGHVSKVESFVTSTFLRDKKEIRD